MKSRRSARLGSVALATVAFAAALTGTAWAPKNLFLNTFNSTCTLSTGEAGTVTNGGFTLETFVVDHDGSLEAEGTLIAQCIDRAVTEEFNETVTASVEILEASCDGFRLSLEGTEENNKGTVINVDPVDILYSNMGVPRGVYCALGKVEDTGNYETLARLLNGRL